MTALGWRLAALALVLGLAVGGRVAWRWQAADYGQQLSTLAGEHETDKARAAAAALAALNTINDERRALEARLQSNDQTHYQELTNVRKDQARLRDRLATADLRLSVLLAQPAGGGDGGVRAAAGAGGVVHGASRAQLDPAHAQRIVGITDDGDQGLIALQACQAYARGIAQK
ncbi:lysis protein [Pseudomonas japonica]|uniref:lysis protein n=1 Tax=Pseudomonas japonica TaxID=256466 RepID=UPI003A8C4709